MTNDEELEKKCIKCGSKNLAWNTAIGGVHIVPNLIGYACKDCSGYSLIIPDPLNW